MKKVEYTVSARKRLDQLHNDLDVQIQEYIVDQKYILGDDIIEITASDVDKISERIRIYRPTKTFTRQMIIYIYSVTGALSIIIGLFYNDFKSLIEDNPIRLAMIVSGLGLILISVLFSYMYKIRERRYKDYQKYKVDNIEKQKYYGGGFPDDKTTHNT